MLGGHVTHNSILVPKVAFSPLAFFAQHGVSLCRDLREREREGDQ